MSTPLKPSAVATITIPATGATPGSLNTLIAAQTTRLGTRHTILCNLLAGDTLYFALDDGATTDPTLSTLTSTVGCTTSFTGPGPFELNLREGSDIFAVSSNVAGSSLIVQEVCNDK